MKSETILFIVEGAKHEPSLIEKINKIYKFKYDIEIYSYKNPIYELIDKLYEELVKDEYLDILLLLKEYETSKREKQKLSKLYTGIYLIFDFEPHYPKFDIKRLIMFKKFFNESLDGGLLLINYPMIEAFKHLKEMPDNEFKNRTIKKNHHIVI